MTNIKYISGLGILDILLILPAQERVDMDLHQSEPFPPVNQLFNGLEPDHDPS